ncbi:alpha/beta fold hydrolase [Streptomyces sp. GC420]|uniref:alpha/beta fold hydrolase n=1 Tax=Streptomyces sp. GC420 TaxID=2697568 RepID=UPI0014150F62|nr:alpha/beta hydrolase [Streptomyces sp. GC420]NBM14222.1 alpha/beta fold hydrolase [Streptomyces sp. GC420]
MTVTSTTESRRIKAGGVDTTYFDSGVGEPVILIHGSGPGASAWANWRKMIGPLSENFRVIALDLVGWGTTERPDDVWYSLETWTDQVLGLMDALEVDEASFVGNSLGGRIALELASRHPERVQRMVLMGSPGLGMVPTEALKALRSYEPSYDAMEDLLVNVFVCDPVIITPDLVLDRYEASIAPGAHEAYRSMFFDEKHAGNDLGITPEVVSAIETPTLVVHGREDRVVPLQVGINMAQALRNADMHVFGNCGHWTQLERADDFNAVVEQFLSS